MLKLFYLKNLSQINYFEIWHESQATLMKPW